MVQETVNQQLISSCLLYMHGETLKVYTRAGGELGGKNGRSCTIYCLYICNTCKYHLLKKVGKYDSTYKTVD